jgi:hypothetical protein
MTTPTEWKTGAGTVRVLPARSRLLDLTISGHSSLWSPEPAPFPWCLGGERLWFGPEADWFWQRLGSPDFAHYKVPADLDPDLWTVDEEREGYFRASLQATLRSAHRDAFVVLRAERSMELLDPAMMAGPTGGLGLVTATTMEILDGTPGQPVDLWSLLQVPQGGRMIIPTLGPCAPRDYFKPAPPGEVTVHPTHTEIAIRGAAAFKLGFPPSRVAGRLAYVRPVEEGHLVLARSCLVDPGLRYADAPLHALGTQGDVFQFYCDDGSVGPFGEFEHRTPAIFCGTGPQRYAEIAITRLMLLDDSAYAEWFSEFLPT